MCWSVRSPASSNCSRASLVEATTACETSTPPGFCAFLQPSCDVDVVPEDVMWLHKHVTEIYANTELKPVAARRTNIPGPNGILEGDCEPDRACGARELGEEPVSSVLDDPRTMQREFRAR